MLMYPVFGIGVNNFPRAEGMLSERAKNLRPTDAGIKWSAPHNSYLEAAAEMGIPGGLLWLILVPGGVVAMYRLSRRLPRSWLHGDAEERFLYLAGMYLPVAMTGFAVSSFFVSFTYIDPVYILAALMAGMYISVDRKLKSSTARVPARAPIDPPSARLGPGPEATSLELPRPSSNSPGMVGPG